MGRRFFKAVVVAATTGVGVGLLTPMAAHAAVGCGQSITSSMTLDHDLNCPTSDGIIVNASNVVLDLGGHTITGGATSGGGRRGVGVSFDRHNVVVKNGVVRGFDQGVRLSGRADATITGMVLDANGSGIHTETDSAGSRIVGNSIVNTIQFSGIQMGGNGHVVENNDFNNVASTGVFLSGNNNVIRNNRLNGAGASAIVIGAFPSNPGPFVNNQIIGNQVAGSSRTFTSSSISLNNGSGTVIQANVVNGRRTTPGVFVFNSANTVVSGNTLVNNSSGVLVRGTSTGTQVIGNQANQSTFAGVVIENAPTGTLVADNIASGNGGNGIDVRSASTTITRNTAQFNRGLGIFAVTGVTDGGGNRAFGNGNPAQCSPNIICS